MLGAKVSGSCSLQQRQRAQEIGVDRVYDYRTTDLLQIQDRFDVVYDTAGTVTVATGLGLLHRGGVYLDINPTPGKFIRAMFDRRLKPIVCTARADILDGIARAAAKLRLPVAEIVPLEDAISLITALEQGRKLNGKALVSMP